MNQEQDVKNVANTTYDFIPYTLVKKGDFNILLKSVLCMEIIYIIATK